MNDILKDSRFAPLDLTAAPPAHDKYKPERSAEDVKRIFEIAMKVWEVSFPIAGTIAETYLREARKISFGPWPEALRYQEKCYHGPTKTRRPALIALMTGAVDNKPQGIQRIFLERDGSGKASDLPKHEQKMMLGKSEGAVVRLIEDSEVTYGLGIAEGVETALSVMSMGWQPVWAALSSGNIANFPFLGVNLTIFADCDHPGLEAARACSDRWRNAGGDCRIVAPQKAGSDWND